MSEKRLCWILTFLLGGNLVVIAVFFAYPRIEFIAARPGASHEEILASPGTRDWVNFNYKRYLVPVLQLRDSTETDAALIFASIFPAAYAYRYLYPRSLYFAYKKDEFEQSVRDHHGGPLYVVIQTPYFTSAYLEGLTYQNLASGWRMASLESAGQQEETR